MPQQEPRIAVNKKSCIIFFLNPQKRKCIRTEKTGIKNRNLFENIRDHLSDPVDLAENPESYCSLFRTDGDFNRRAHLHHVIFNSQNLKGPLLSRKFKRIPRKDIHYVTPAVRAEQRQRCFFPGAGP